MSKFPLNIAHRGASKLAPENTMPAFIKAIEQGCDGIECDINITKDGEFIVMHDDTVDRTTNGHGYVISKTLQELKGLDAGAYFSKEYKGTTIPTLDEVLKLVIQNNIIINLDIKFKHIEVVDKIIEVIHKYNYEDKTIIGSFNESFLMRSKQIEERIQTQVCFFWTTKNIKKYLKKSKVNIVCPHFLYVLYKSKLYVRLLQSKGKLVQVFTVDSESLMKKMIKKDVNGIITNRPDTLNKLKNNII